MLSNREQYRWNGPVEVHFWVIMWVYSSRGVFSVPVGDLHLPPNSSCGTGMLTRSDVNLKTVGRIWRYLRTPRNLSFPQTLPADVGQGRPTVHGVQQPILVM